jgi:hypothetical protein
MLPAAGVYAMQTQWGRNGIIEWDAMPMRRRQRCTYAEGILDNFFSLTTARKRED